MAAIEFDPQKDASNIAKHGISLARAADLIIFYAVYDDRRDYGEDRVLAYGHIDGLIYCLCYVERSEGKRAISLRRAHQEELRRHDNERQN